MKYSNGDMDDLFRRASERYPLRTDSADWGRLASALDGEPAPPSDQEEKRRRRGFIWWFLLIPLTGIGYLTWQVGTQHTPGKGNVATAQSGKIAAPVTEAGTGQGGNAAGSGNAVQAGNAVGGGVAVQAGSARAGGEEVRKLRSRENGGAIEGDVHGSRIGGGSAGRDVRGTRGEEEGISGGGKVRNTRTGNAGGMDAVGNGGAGDHELVLAALDLRRAPIGGGYHVVVDVVAPVVAADSAAPAAKKQTKKNSHGYIGVIGAPDLSTVHFQTMKGVGTTFGVLLGYSFNERWAVETGLYLDRKRYYTAGEYFNTKNVRTPPYSTLLNVDGTCYMWEIPVNVRYNFSTGPRMKWFATAGLSTYLMSKEDYTYQYETNSGTDTNQWNLHRPSQYWFSIINLSAGFEQHIGKIGNLRLEPYVRIPLSGIGAGNLPIVSAGLNIGFTRRLW